MSPFSIRIEKAPPARAAWTAIVLGASLFAAALSAAIILDLYGLAPAQTFDLLFLRTLGSSHGWSEIIRRGTPILLIGLGILAGSRAQFWNLGANGQMLIGAIVASGIALFSPLPGLLLLPVMIIAGTVAGAFWALIPCLLKAKLGINEIITGLMMNYVASNIVDYLIQGPWRGATAMGYAYTDSFPKTAWLPLISGTRISWCMTLIGILFAIVLYGVLFQTRMGLRVRVLGESPAAGRYAGISSYHVFLWIALVAGGSAGLAGVNEVAATHHRLTSASQITLGYGFTAVIVALLARGNPLYVLATSVLLGVILASSDVITVVLHLPMEVINVFTGLILYFLICGDFFLHFHLHWRWREPTLEPVRMSDDLIVGAIDRAIAYATPILWLAMGEICAETAGIVNLALDGMLVTSALASCVAAQLTHSLIVGIFAGMVTGVLVAAPHAFASISLQADQYVSGLAFAMFCPGVASLLGRNWVGLPLENPLPSLSIPGLDRLPFIGPAFFTDQCILAYLAPLAALGLAGFFYYTRWGIIWRSAGESPAALDASGISVVGLRYGATLLGGLFAGIGGAYLSLYYEPAWVEGITGGMGWIAFSIVIFSRWNPLQAVGGALLFGALYHFSYRLQEQVNPHILKAFPYIFVVLFLAIGSWRGRRGDTPLALGVPFFRENR